MAREGETKISNFPHQDEFERMEGKISNEGFVEQATMKNSNYEVISKVLFIFLEARFLRKIR